MSDYQHCDFDAHNTTTPRIPRETPTPASPGASHNPDGPHSLPHGTHTTCPDTLLQSIAVLRDLLQHNTDHCDTAEGGLSAEQIAAIEAVIAAAE